MELEDIETGRDYIIDKYGKFICYKDELTEITSDEWDNRNKSLIGLWDKNICEYRYYKLPLSSKQESVSECDCTEDGRTLCEEHYNETYPLPDKQEKVVTE